MIQILDAVTTKDQRICPVIFSGEHLGLFLDKTITVYVGSLDRDPKNFPNQIAVTGPLEEHNGQYRVVTPNWDGSFVYFEASQVREIRAAIPAEEAVLDQLEHAYEPATFIQWLKCGCADDTCGGAALAVIRIEIPDDPTTIEEVLTP